jgi:membrane fusion protein (multidrug efflux system)
VVQVRAQVSGVIVARLYIEGTDVRKGTVLFRIDPRTYEANSSAEARWPRAKPSSRTLNEPPQPAEAAVG